MQWRQAGTGAVTLLQQATLIRFFAFEEQEKMERELAALQKPLFASFPRNVIPTRSEPQPHRLKS